MGHRHNRKRTRGGRRQHQHRSSSSSLASTPSLRQPDPLLGLSLFMTDASAGSGSSIWAYSGRSSGLGPRDFSVPPGLRRASADRHMSSSLSSLASMDSINSSTTQSSAYGGHALATARQFGLDRQRCSDRYQNSAGSAITDGRNMYAVGRDADSMDKLEGSAERVVRFLFDGGMDYE